MSNKDIGIAFKIKSYGVEETKNSVWCSSVNYNGLTEINKKSGRIQNIYKYPEHPINARFLYSRVILCGHYLVSIPFWSGDVAVFDIENKSFNVIRIEEEYLCDKVGASLAAYVYSDYVYIFPAGLRCIIKVDVEKSEISYLTEGLEEVLKQIKENEIIFRQQYTVIDGRVFLGLATLGGYAIFDPSTEHIDIKNIGQTKGVVTVDKIGENIYMAAWAEKIIYKIPGHGDIEELKDFPKEYDFSRYAVADSICEGRYIYYFPLYANMILRFDPENERIDSNFEYIARDKDSIITYFADKAGIMTNDYEGIRIIDDSFGKLSLRGKFDFDVKYNAGMLSDYIIEDEYFKCAAESKNMNLNKFLTILTGKVGN